MTNQLTTMPRYEAYKDSGVEWLGEIPSEWEVQRIKFLLTEVNERSETGAEELLSLSKYAGVVPKSSLEERAGQANTLIGYKKVLNDHLVVNKMQAVNGLLAVSKINGITSPDYAVYKSKNKCVLNIYFLNYLLLQPEYLDEFKKRVTGVMEGFIRLYTDDLYDIKAILPPSRIQTGIVNFLDQKTTQIDQAIKIKEKQAALLEERKQILIKNAVSRGLNPDAPMRDSGVEWIGEIPAHWFIKRTKYLFFEVDERSADGEEELLSVSHITGVTPRSEKNVTMFLAEDYTGSKTCRKDDLVFNIMWAWMGALGVSEWNGIVSPSYGVFRQIKPDTLNSQYIELLLKTTGYIEHYNKVSTGLHSSRLRFYSHMFFNMKLGYPPKNEQDEIVAYIETESEKIDNATAVQQQQIEKLKEYKATLINSAVTGKIKVA